MAWLDLRGELAELFGELAGTVQRMEEALFQAAVKKAAYVAAWRKANPERAKKQREVYKAGAAGKAAQKRYLASAKGKEMSRAKNARYRAKLKLQRAAG